MCGWLADAAACGPDRRRVAEDADSQVDAGVRRGAARSWRWSGPWGGRGEWVRVVLAPRWDVALGGQQQQLSGFREQSCLYSDNLECWIPALCGATVMTFVCCCAVLVDKTIMAPPRDRRRGSGENTRLVASSQICLASLAGRDQDFQELPRAPKSCPRRPSRPSN